MKLCKDCRHYIAGVSKTFDRCAMRERMSPVDPVRGQPEHYYADIERNSPLVNRCGPEARYFVGKPTAQHDWSFDANGAPIEVAYGPPAEVAS